MQPDRNNDTPPTSTSEPVLSRNASDGIADERPAPSWVKSMLSTFSDVYGIPYEEMYDVFDSQYIMYTRIPFMSHDQLKTLCRERNIHIRQSQTRSSLLDILLYPSDTPKHATKSVSKPRRIFQQESIKSMIHRLQKVREPLVLTNIPDTEFMYHEQTGYVFNASSQVIGKLVIQFSHTQIKPLTEADRELCNMYRFDIEAWTNWVGKGVAIPPIHMDLHSKPDKSGIVRSYDKTTSYVVSSSGNVIEGKFAPDNSVVPLTSDDILWCQLNGILYSIPVQLKSSPMPVLSTTSLDIKVDVCGHEHVVDPATGYVIHGNRYVVGKWNQATLKVDELTSADITWCQEHYVQFKYPIVVEKKSDPHVSTGDVCDDPKAVCEKNIQHRVDLIKSSR
jgi:hypothetical protein